MKGLGILSFLTMALLGSAFPAASQSHMYIDRAGNIEFVQSLHDVPLEYRDQVVFPTPAPISERFVDAKRKPVKKAAKKRLSKEEKKALKQQALYQRNLAKAQRKTEAEAQRSVKAQIRSARRAEQENPLGLANPTP